ncbi:MAG: MerR family transcriptional regulator [Candidatus Eisenbacteria bacterium]
MMSIGEVAQQAQIRPSAIRYYERLGLLPSPARASGRRRYGEDILLQLEVIRFARQSGFTLREIRQLFAGRPYSSGLRELAAQKVNDLDGLIARAQGMQLMLRRALRCKCLSLQECARQLRRTNASRMPK